MKPAASLRALLTNLIDYAGMFPPASLSLDESIRNYARYVKEPDAWILGRFICPAARLEELAPYVNEFFSEASPLKLTSISRTGTTARDFHGFREEFAEIKAFEIDHDGRAKIESFEGKLPGGVAFAAAPKRRDLFFEATESTRESTNFVIQSVGIAGDGFKLRTGGVEAKAFPRVDLIAFAIATCRDRKVPMKFTAGLHHPIRHFNSSVNTKMHGFINVFAAGVLAHALNLSEEQLIPILSDEDPASFKFDDDGLGWKDYRATIRQIEDARRGLVISYGSCSFDEPRDDLRSLGWL